MLRPFTERSRPAFFPAGEYPELESLRSQWRDVRDEGLSLRDKMMWVDDERTTAGSWAFGPLMLEAGDRTPDRDRLSEQLRRQAARTMALLEKVPDLLGCGFSLLRARGQIGAHSHAMPNVTAILGLSSANPCRIIVNGQSRHIQPGRLTIFDYSHQHEVINDSDNDRLVLLVLLPNRYLLGVGG